MKHPSHRTLVHLTTLENAMNINSLKRGRQGAWTQAR